MKTVERALASVLGIIEDEIKPRADYRDARKVFAEIFPEKVPPVLRDYGAYVVECSRLRIQPLSRDEWNQRKRTM
jgi:hypothetical protein